MLKIYMIIAAVAFTLGTGSGYKVRDWIQSAKDLATHTATQELITIFEAKESKVAAAVELKLQELTANETIIERFTKEIIERPVYINDCIDTDGLRLINSIISGETGEFAFEVPGQLVPNDWFEWPASDTESEGLD